jgi:hypothetical protein
MLSSSTTVQHDETERLKSLLQYEILDTLPDPAFDEIARMAASICNAPYAFIGFLDWSRVWFKSRLVSRLARYAATGRPASFCYSMASRCSSAMPWRITALRRRASCSTMASNAAPTRALLCSLPRA